MLGSCDLLAFVATSQPDKARAFYCDLLGMRFEEDGPFALIVSAANVTIRIKKVQSFWPLPFTAMGWRVGDIDEKVRALQARGIKFERFDGMDQNERGIWTSPSQAKVCWFKDPDGNLLSLSQAP